MDVSNAKQWEVIQDIDKGNKNEKDENLFNWGTKDFFQQGKRQKVVGNVEIIA